MNSEIDSAGNKMMGEDLNNFIKVWLIAIASACYCYTLSNLTTKGILRLFFVLPINYLFTTLPFTISSYNLGGTTFFFLLWLSNFKLILFSFDLGPLPEAHSLPHFMCTLLFPIKVNHTKTQTQDDLKVIPSKEVDKSRVHWGRFAVFGIKCLALACVFELYKHKRSLPYYILPGLYCFHIYLSLELILPISGALPKASLGLQLVPQMNEPYLTTSLQDFWGRRWNLMVSDILRQTVHKPICSIASPFIGKKGAIAVGIFGSFLVSGLMHELIFYKLTGVSPTWEVTCFFILHGACTVIEVQIKSDISDKWQLPLAISRTLTLGFVAFTGAWLFLPQLLRNEVLEKGVNECATMLNSVNQNLQCWFNVLALT